MHTSISTYRDIYYCKYMGIFINTLHKHITQTMYVMLNVLGVSACLCAESLSHV